MKRQMVFFVFMTLFVLVSGTGAQETNTIAAQDSIEQITIRQSGFMKNGEIVIRFRSSDHEIVEVTDGGKKIPAEDFYKYESVLWSYLDLQNIERLKPRIERLRRELMVRPRLDSLKIRHLQSIDSKLDSLRVRFVREKSRHSRQLLERTLELDRKLSVVRERLEEVHANLDKFLDALIEEKIISDRENLDIEFRKGDCFIDGRKVSSDIKKRIKEIYREIHNKDINEEKFTLKM